MSPATQLTRTTASGPDAAGADGSRRDDDHLTRRLVRRAIDGDQRAWDELVAKFGGLVWSVARAHRLSPADAAEVSQITWLRLVENLDRLHDPARVGAWLATTARRECIRQLSATSRTVPQGDDLLEQDSQSPPPDAGLLASERDQALWSGLARLPDRDRRLLRLLMSDPAPAYTEISAALAMPIGSIGPTRARALERLRRELGRSGLSERRQG